MSLSTPTPVTMPAGMVADEDPLWTVAGVLPATRRRHAAHVQAPTPRQAEDTLAAHVAALGERLWVAAVLPGQLPAADVYALYADDPDRGGEELLDIDFDPADAPPCGPGPYTVVGLMREQGDTAWNAANNGRRHVIHVQAAGPRQAEDHARLVEAPTLGGELWVASVFFGRHVRADAYATFADPDQAVRPT